VGGRQRYPLRSEACNLVLQFSSINLIHDRKHRVWDLVPKGHTAELFATDYSQTISAGFVPMKRPGLQNYAEDHGCVGHVNLLRNECLSISFEEDIDNFVSQCKAHERTDIKLTKGLPVLNLSGNFREVLA